MLSTDTFLHKKLGRYEIRERIGVGGMARVFMGWDTNLERQVAIKILHEHLVANTNFKERFEREAKLVATLNHPNIVQIYDYNMTIVDEQLVCYMVMPYFPGSTLEDLLSENKVKNKILSTDRILEILLDLGAALGYAHERSMIHRDIKPSNVIFDEHNRAILTDFGIARLKEGGNLTQDGATVGTPSYMSPEQATGLPIDSRTDIYSLGVIAYEMLSGELPFTGESVYSIIFQHANAPIPHLPNTIATTNVFIQSFIFKALAKSPEDRYQTASEFTDGLKRALQNTNPSPVTNETHNFELAGAQVSQQSKSLLLTNETQNITPDFLKVSQLSTKILPLSAVANSPRRSRVELVIFITIALMLGVGVVFILNNNVSNATNLEIIKTPISSMTQDEGMPFRSEYRENDPNSMNWQQNNEGNVKRQITSDGLYKIENELPATATTSLYHPSATFLNGTISMLGALENTSADSSGLGIIFHYQDESNYNVFAVDGSSRFSIWRLKNGEWHELRDMDERWTESEFILPKGQQNNITITFNNDQFIGYVNHHIMTSLTLDDNSVMPGAVGIYVASTINGNATALIDTYEVGDQLPSMTADLP